MQGNRRPASVVTYFVQAIDGGPVKIGYTGADTLTKRLNAIQTGNPWKLQYTRVVNGNREREFHTRFRALRMAGEWFVPDAELARFAKAKPSIEAADDMAYFRRGFMDGWLSATKRMHDEFADHMFEQAHAFAGLRGATLEDAELHADAALNGEVRGRIFRAPFASPTSLTLVTDGEAA